MVFHIVRYCLNSQTGVLEENQQTRNVDKYCVCTEKLDLDGGGIDGN